MVDENTQPQETPQMEAPQEPIPALEPIPEPQTAQIPPNEPLPSTPVEEVKPEPETTEPEIPEVEAPEPKSESASPTEAMLPSVPLVIPQTNPIRELLNNARFAIQTRKKKKLEKIMKMFEKKSHITNDEVEKLLHVSDATATRYLTILKKENKIKQNGKTGKSVSYSKI